MASWAVFRHGDADRDDGGPAGVAQGTEEGNGNGNGREGRGNTTDSTAAEDETGSSPATTGGPAADEPTADEPGGPSDGSEGSAVEVPDDWVSYEHPEGAYSIRYPPSWQVVPASGPRIDFRDPATGTYLRVDWTTEPQPDPVADWEQQATHFAARHTGYERIRIEPYQYRDYNAALWEFRYQGGSSRLHVGNLGFVTADGDRAYALYFQTSDGRWADSQTLFAQFREAFQPA
jgi:eukaryotic-like serine/threonine-protein kinase